jgi:hypothetical protein
MLYRCHPVRDERWGETDYRYSRRRRTPRRVKNHHPIVRQSVSLGTQNVDRCWYVDYLVLVLGGGGGSRRRLPKRAEFGQKTDRLPCRVCVEVRSYSLSSRATGRERLLSYLYGRPRRSLTRLSQSRVSVLLSLFRGNFRGALVLIQDEILLRMMRKVKKERSLLHWPHKKPWRQSFVLHRGLR